MITTSEIIKKLLKKHGYTSIKGFAKKHNMRSDTLFCAVWKNSWTKDLLERLGNILGEDLSMLATVKFGGGKKSRKL